MSLIGTMALFLMIMKWTVNDKEINVFWLKFLSFIVVLVCLWWKP